MSVKEQLLNLVGQVQDCGCDVTDVVKMNYVENDVLVDHLIANGVIILPVPIGTMIWEVVDYYDNCDCCAKLDFNQVPYRPFEHVDHAVLLNTGKFGGRNRTYFDTLEHAAECLKQKVLTGEWDGPLVVGCVDGYYRHKRKEEIQGMLSKNVANQMSLQ